MENTQPVYRHSGRKGNVILFIIGGIAIALVTGALYSCLDVWIPLKGKVSALLLLAFACALGFGISAMGKAARCRSVSFLITAGSLFGLLAWYMSWVTFEFVLVRRDDPTFGFQDFVLLFSRPQGVWNVAKSIAATGWYTMSGVATRGSALWIEWGIEFLVVIGFATALAAYAVRESVFCETTGGWCKKWAPIRLALPADEAARQSLLGGDWSLLPTLAAVQGYIYPRLNVMVNESPRPGGTHTWQIFLHEQITGRKNSKTEKLTKLTPRYLASDSAVECLALLAKRGEQVVG
jgi:hypothetical protein